MILFLVRRLGLTQVMSLGFWLFPVKKRTGGSSKSCQPMLWATLPRRDDPCDGV